ncbi:MAG: alpha/beta fold hydrolase [Candidatus Palauibacterales bacterium]|nr:alpha/beta fold hydrolase [Candidatus Palauibacterales bacterium]MDP2528181.1 alpha/beta fold hydrolase [Candidatus Palauibacterales bacterium]MDP2584658.1 alpha/beta fold hydrolase [Candidatus Palauibacterales bacterium]
MDATAEVGHRDRRAAAGEARALLTEGLPVRERRAELAATPTTWLEGGEGPPLVLLHGPGESGVNWRWVIPELVRDHRVVAPDLPGHGSSGGAGVEWTEPRILDWLEAVIEDSCSGPPVLVGHVLGGAIAARFARDRGSRIRGLVLVDSLGLAPFRPSLRFLATLIGFRAHPTETTHRWFMGQCAHDLERLQERTGERWDAFVAYNLETAGGPRGKAAGRMLKGLGLPRIPPEELAEIAVPTTLIWGRHDRANRLRIATEASERYGWPLYVVEDAADDPARDQPEKFLEALRAACSHFDRERAPMSQTTHEESFAKKAAESYERHFVPAIGRPVASDLIEAADLRPGERVLDVACGTGIVSRLAAERVGPEGSVAGLDPNPAMLAVAREAASTAPPIAWHHAPAEEIPLEDESFDVVLCGMGVQFFEDRTAGLRQIRRVLSPGGRFVANVPGPTPAPLQAMAEGLGRHVSPRCAGFVDAVFSLHDADDVRLLVEEAGFGRIRVSSKEMALDLGTPRDFLRHYVESTPLAAAVAEVDREDWMALERDFVEACGPWLTDGALKGTVRLTTMVAMK